MVRQRGGRGKEHFRGQSREGQPPRRERRRLIVRLGAVDRRRGGSNIEQAGTLQAIWLQSLVGGEIMDMDIVVNRQRRAF